jgi:ribonuclease HI
MPKNNFYVVWRGKKPGIYPHWNECRKQVEGFPGALYKGFPTEEQARSAAMDDPMKYMSRELHQPRRIICSNPDIGEPLTDSICVDAACSGNPGVLEYRGVDTFSGAELFHKGPFPEGTVNIGEFLAVVHALAYLKKIGSDWPVYSDSRTALAWLRNREIKTTLALSDKNRELFAIVTRALKWIRANEWPNPVLKWETEYWGEIPADFGRK